MPASQVDQAMDEEPSDGFAAFFVARFDGIPAGRVGLTASGELTAHVRVARVFAVAAEVARCCRPSRTPRARSACDACGSTRATTSSKPARSTAPRGYAAVPAFNTGPYADHWFEKVL